MKMLLVAALAACGCDPGAAVTFRGLRNPVLLGPRDRLGGGARSPAAKVASFTTVGVRMSAEMGDGQRASLASPRSGPRRDALDATRGDPALDIRIRELVANTTVVGLGLATDAEWIDVEGDVVRAGEQRP